MTARLKNDDSLWIRYPKAGRQWFLDQLKTHFPTLDENGIKNKVLLARDMVRRRLELSYEPFKTTWEMGQGSFSKIWGDEEKNMRAEIFYGAIGNHSEFLEPQHEAFFDFITARRHRIVTRLRHSVNPYSRSQKESHTFVYPLIPTQTNYELNVDSIAYWSSRGGGFPFVLTSRGRTNPVEAVESLFVPYPQEKETSHKEYQQVLDNRNKLGCESVSVIVHLDSLLVAKDPKKLLTEAINEDSDYIIIDHPVGTTVFSNGRHVVTGATKVAEDARTGDTKIKVETIFPYPGTEVHETAQGIFYRGPLKGFLNIDGSNMGVINEGSEHAIIVKGIGIDSATINDNTLYTHWYEVQPLRKNVPKGSWITNLDFPVARHFLNDLSSDSAYFEQLYIDKKDLQPGDHIILPNHPLYRRINEGVWQAEHSFVTSVYHIRHDIRTSGHGLEGELVEIGRELLGSLNGYVAFIQAVTRIHVGRPVLEAVKQRCLNELGEIISCNSPDGAPNPDVRRRLDLFIYKPFKFLPYQWYNDSLRNSVDEIYVSDLSLDGYITAYQMPEQRALYENEKTHKETLRVLQIPGQNSLFSFNYRGKQMDIFVHEGEDIRSVKLWRIGYNDERHVNQREFKLFTDDLPNLPKGNSRWVTYDDLKNLFPIYQETGNARVRVIRPRVDFSDAYKNFLKRNKAIE